MELARPQRAEGEPGGGSLLARQDPETTAHETGDAVRRLVGAAFDHATLLLKDNKALLEEGSNR